MTINLVDQLVFMVIKTGDFLGDINHDTLEAKSREYARWEISTWCSDNEVNESDISTSVQEDVCGKLYNIGWDRLTKQQEDADLELEEGIASGDLDKNGDFIPYPKYYGV